MSGKTYRKACVVCLDCSKGKSFRWKLRLFCNERQQYNLYFGVRFNFGCKFGSVFGAPATLKQYSFFLLFYDTVSRMTRTRAHNATLSPAFFGCQMESHTTDDGGALVNCIAFFRSFKNKSHNATLRLSRGGKLPNTNFRNECEREMNVFENVVSVYEGRWMASNMERDALRMISLADIMSTAVSVMDKKHSDLFWVGQLND